jgi:hypothetical protein
LRIDRQAEAAGRVDKQKGEGVDRGKTSEFFNTKISTRDGMAARFTSRILESKCGKERRRKSSRTHAIK